MRQYIAMFGYAFQISAELATKGDRVWYVMEGEERTKIYVGVLSCSPPPAIKLINAKGLAIMLGPLCVTCFMCTLKQNRREPHVRKE